VDLNARYDVVVVGSGAGGAAAALRLVQQGAKVLMLEAGPRFDRIVDYPQSNRDWEKNLFLVKPGSQGAVQYGDLGKLEPEFADLQTWSRHRPSVLPALGEPRRAAVDGYSHVQGVGGSTLHFVGEANRIHPNSFDAGFPETELNWPLSYADLEPYYAHCETIIGVACDEPTPDRWRSRPFPMKGHPISPGGTALMLAGKKLGSQWHLNPRAANSEAYDERPACNYCGQCSRGCPLGDKGSADVTFLHKAIATERLVIVENTPVTKLRLGRDRRVSHIEVNYLGQKQEIETPILILAAGAVQTPRLLLLSSSTSQPNGVANSSGQVGRNFMETLWWSSAGLVPGLKNSHMGLPADVADWSRTAPGTIPGVSGGFKLTHTTLDTGLNGPIGFATRMLGGFGAELKQELRDKFGSALAVSAVGQTIPDDRSFIALSPDQLDQNGLPLPQINSVLTTNSHLMLREMANSCREVLAAANAEVLEESSCYSTFLSTHVFGTARMGADASNSVVDATCRSHDHPNLLICDASVFPSTGGGEAPALTIMALATRAAEYVLG